MLCIASSLPCQIHQLAYPREDNVNPSSFQDTPFDPLSLPHPSVNLPFCAVAAPIGLRGSAPPLPSPPPLRPGTEFDRTGLVTRRGGSAAPPAPANHSRAPPTHPYLSQSASGWRRPPSPPAAYLGQTRHTRPIIRQSHVRAEGAGSAQRTLTHVLNLLGVLREGFRIIQKTFIHDGTPAL